MSEVTEANLRLIHAGNPQVLVMLAWSSHQINGTHTYDNFSELVEDAIEWSLRQIAQNPKERQNDDENSLTSIVVSHLRCIGFQVEYDGTLGGHCDIIVRYGTQYTWIGEAKIYKSYQWLLKGYLQLTSRYSTGLPNEDRGGMLIYFKVDDMQQKMRNWSDALIAYNGQSKSGSKRRSIAVSAVPKPANGLRSVQAHQRTGRDYSVVHFPLSIYWNPKV